MTSSDTINLIQSSAALSTSSLSLSQQHVSTQAVVTDWQFFTLIVATIAFTFFQPQIYGVEEFYRSCFHRKNKNPDTGKKDEHHSRLGPPRWVWFDFCWNVVHACLSISIILYVWNYKFPLTPEDSDKYITIECFYIVMILFEKIWRKLFWNWHYSCWALVLACCCMFTVCALTLGMGIAFAVVGNGTAWVGFALFLFIALPWYLLVLGWNAYICYCYWNKSAYCRCHAPKFTGSSSSSSSPKRRRPKHRGGGYEYHGRSQSLSIQDEHGSEMSDIVVDNDNNMRKRKK